MSKTFQFTNSISFTNKQPYSGVNFYVANQINIMKTNLPQTQNLCSPRYSSNILSGSSVLPRVKFHPQYLVFVLQLEKNTIIFINVKWYTIFLSALYNNACHSEACPISPNSDISSSFRIAMYVYNLMVF